jgi:hypothetical protein
MVIDNKEIVTKIRIYPKVTIIILHLKNIQCLIDCIASLNKITYNNYDIIVVNNGPGNTALLDALSPISQHITRVIDTEDNIGFARGNNIGIRQALKDGAEYILLLNDDTEVAPDFLSILIDAAEARPDTGMLGSKIFRFIEPDRVWFAGARFDQDTCKVVTTEYEQTVQSNALVVESDYITGCASLVRRDTIEKIGMLDERFFLYWEDVDWGLRCSKAGLKNLIVPASHIWHKISVTSGGIDSLPRVYHKARSHLFMANIYVPQALCRLQRDLFRDIVWLLLKSSDKNRIKKVLACLLAIIDYHSGKSGKGPHWLWANK